MFGKTYKKILDGFPDGVFVFDDKLRIRFMNAAFRRSFFIEKNRKGPLPLVLSCGKDATCGSLAACAYCAFYRGMKKTVESGKEQTESMQTTVRGAFREDTVSMRIRFYPLGEKGLFFGVATGSYQAAFEREMLSAQKVQQRLLPAGKQAAGVNYAFTYLPCKEIGGDMTDVYELGGMAYGVVADVSGKGVPAAMLSAFAKAGLDRGERDLGGALKKLNEKFNELEQDERSYITVAAVRIDKTAGELHYATAGHNVPILLKNARGIHEIENPSPPISNWVSGFEYCEKPFSFERGDMLVMLTDGVTECKNAAGEMFGIERAESVLLQSRNAEDFNSKIRAALGVFSGGVYSDDVTAVAFDL
ncbi:MAG: SpoIIE family protein phosphatase [Clostridia bacterium]|nr:SpoIIE family protein phosphatase [Clostridia bacterium]